MFLSKDKELPLINGLLIATLFTWLIGFLLVFVYDTWLTFALAGPVLALVAVSYDRQQRHLLKLRLNDVLVGFIVGAVMIVATHIVAKTLIPIVPGMIQSVTNLYDIFSLGGFPVWVRAALVLCIATSEEILFRGHIANPQNQFELKDRPLWIRWVILTTLYALGTVTSFNYLLVLAALGCGLIWGLLRILRRSAVPSIVAHLVWDMGVMIIWPLI